MIIFVLLVPNVLNFRVLKLFFEHKNQSILLQYHETEGLIKTNPIAYVLSFSMAHTKTLCVIKPINCQS